MKKRDSKTCLTKRRGSEQNLRQKPSVWKINWKKVILNNSTTFLFWIWVSMANCYWTSARRQNHQPTIYWVSTTGLFIDKPFNTIQTKATRLTISEIPWVKHSCTSYFFFQCPHININPEVFLQLVWCKRHHISGKFVWQHLQAQILFPDLSSKS